MGRDNDALIVLMFRRLTYCLIGIALDHTATRLDSLRRQVLAAQLRGAPEPHRFQIARRDDDIDLDCALVKGVLANC